MTSNGGVLYSMDSTIIIETSKSANNTAESNVYVEVEYCMLQEILSW